MFDQIKNLYNLKKQAEELQKQMAGEKFTGTAGVVSLTLNGNQDLIDVQIASSESLDGQSIARDFQKAFRSAQDQMKRVMADKFKGMI
jgi:DNA-binding protein YbaB